VPEVQVEEDLEVQVVEQVYLELIILVEAPVLIGRTDPPLAAPVEQVLLSFGIKYKNNYELRFFK
jgi:hypothetical protein